MAKESPNGFLVVGQIHRPKLLITIKVDFMIEDNSIGE